MDPQTPRYYIRCADCLSIGVIEGQYLPGWHCNLCAGPIELMGKVVTDSKVEVERERSACDKRCTHAVGPICVCKCNCANHGTGRVVTTLVVENITKVQFIDDETARINSLLYKDRVVALKTTYDDWRKAAHDYSIPNVKRQPYYYGTYKLRELTKKVVEARTWKARHKHMDAAAQHVLNITAQVASRG